MTFPSQPVLYLLTVTDASESHLSAPSVPNLEQYGFECFSSGTLGQLTDLLNEHDVVNGIALLQGPPKALGYSLTLLRTLFPSLPLVVGCEMNDHAQTPVLFSAGADLLVPSDAPVQVWAAAVSSLFRRWYAQSIAIAEQQEGWVLKGNAAEITTPQGVRVRLTELERLVLFTLLSAPGQSAKRQDLIKAVLPQQSDTDSKQATNHLGVVLSRLRKKFQANGACFPIATVHNWGYRFTEKGKAIPLPD